MRKVTAWRNQSILQMVTTKYSTIQLSRRKYFNTSKITSGMIEFAREAGRSLETLGETRCHRHMNLRAVSKFSNHHIAALTTVFRNSRMPAHPVHRADPE